MKRPRDVAVAEPTIKEVFAESLAAEKQRLAARTYRRYEEVIDLISFPARTSHYEPVATARGPAPVCRACHGSPAAVSVDGRELCDRCADGAIAEATGWPPLPSAPPPEVIVGADGERHVFRYRLFRWPGRVVAAPTSSAEARAGTGSRSDATTPRTRDPCRTGSAPPLAPPWAASSSRRTSRGSCGSRGPR